MLDPIARMFDKPPPSRLEGWLVRSLRTGCLKALPRYLPMGSRSARCPEQYARELLAGLASSRDDVLTLERLKDDGRAFRSWAESAVPHAAHRGPVLRQGFVGH